MSNWHAETGIWCQSSLIWDVDQSIPDDAPDVWFSKPNGDYYIGMSFHFSPFTFVKGNGLTDSNFSFKIFFIYMFNHILTSSLLIFFIIVLIIIYSFIHK